MFPEKPHSPRLGHAFRSVSMMGTWSENILVGEINDSDFSLWVTVWLAGF